MIQQILINGLINGGVYALLAVGFSLIFGVARIINLTHTALYVVSGYLAFTFTTYLGINVFVSFVLSVLGTVVVAVLIYKLFIDRIREHEITVLIITAALAILIQEVILLGFGATYRGLPMFIKGYVEIIGVRVLYQYLITLGCVAVILVALWVLISKTKLGIAIRSTAQDREIANLMGVDVRKINMITMAIAAVLAATAGGIVTPIFVLTPYGWMPILVKVLAIVVLGGLGSIRGSLVGAFILGSIESMVVSLLPMGSFLKDPIYLLVMIVVLLVKPEGLWGVVFEEERL
jgi:branched-chain amino acid transport system permease protein